MQLINKSKTELLYFSGYIFLLCLVPIAMSSLSRDAYFIKYFLWIFGLFCILIVRGNKKNNIPKALFLFFVSALISTIFAYNTELSSRFFIRIILWVITFIVVRDTFQSRYKDYLFEALLFVSIVLSIYGILEYNGIEFFEWKSGVSATFGNQNFYSDYLALMIPIAIYYFYFSFKNNKSVFYKIYSALRIALLIIALAFAKSRGAYLGFIISSFILILVLIKRNKKILIGLIIVSAVSFIPVYKIFVNELLTIDRVLKGGFEVRIPIWYSTMDIIKDNLLTGIGPDNFKAVYTGYRRKEETKFSGINLIHHAHNDYIQFFAETGIGGITFFALFIIMLLSKAFRSRDIFKMSLAASEIGLLVCAAFSFPFYLEVEPVIFFTFAGIIAAEDNDITLPKFNLLNAAYGVSFLFIAIMFLSEMAGSAYLKSGLLYKAQSKFNNAEEILYKSVLLNRTDYLTHYNLGESYLRDALRNGKREKYISSIKWITSALKRNRFETPYWNNLAAAFFYLGDYNYAAKYYLISLRNQYFSKEARNGLVSSYISIGSNCLTNGLFDDAEKYFMRAFIRNKKSAEAAHNLAYLYQLNDYIEKAIKYYNISIKNNPSAQNDYVSLGDLYMQKKDGLKAVESYKKALGLEKHTPAYDYAKLRLQGLIKK